MKHTKQLGVGLVTIGILANCSGETEPKSYETIPVVSAAPTTISNLGNFSCQVLDAENAWQPNTVYVPEDQRVRVALGLGVTVDQMLTGSSGPIECTPALPEELISNGIVIEFGTTSCLLAGTIIALNNTPFGVCYDPTGAPIPSNPVAVAYDA